MKRTILKIASILTAAVSICSCKWADGILDLDPTDRYSVASVWSTESSADLYLLGLYNFLKENSGNVGCNSNLTAVWDAYSDILKSNSWNQYNHPYNSAFLQGDSFNSESAGVFECWSDCYTRIRRCNEFLRDCPVYGAKFGEEFVQSRMAEMKFIRAFAHFKLMMVYGKCIIRDAVDGPEQNDKALASADDAWDFIISDLTDAGEHIADGLPRGRVSKAAAWALLSRVALFAERWDTAIEAADKCKECGGVLDPKYTSVFNNINSPELLLPIEFAQNKLSHRGDVFFRPSGDGQYHNNATVYAVFGPTSEYVDRFEMADGQPFSWSVNGKDPYTGRDPRFYASILYNGAKWEGRTIETFKGGEDGIAVFDIGGAAGSTVTGYYLKKFINEGEEGWEKYGSSHYAIFIRYAEVLLNKAEALANQGHFAEAYDALNEVRERAGMPKKSGSDMETFMKDLENEKIVELGGEGLRFWDLRRWRTAVVELEPEKSIIDGKNFHGCEITKNPDNTYSYKQISCDGDGKTHFFAVKYYAFNIPVSEFSNNKALDKEKDTNFGW